MNTNTQKGVIEWIIILGAIVLLGLGAFAGRLWNNQKSRNQGEGATTTPSEVLPTVATSESKGIVSGYLIYPSEQIPEELGVCAQKIDNLEMITCTNQIKNEKFKNGVGYELNLDPGNYYVYSFLGDTKAYYTEFVLCGLKAECKSHTKIPVVVTAGSIQDNILPHDWYDFSDSPSPAATSTPKPTATPTAQPTLATPKVTLSKINPGVLRIIPTSTPTLIPTIKIINPIEIPKIELGW